MDDLIVYTLPVSGGGFVAQLGLLSELSEALKLNKVHSIQPDLIFSASGGNVAAYIAMAGGWTTEGIRRVARHINMNIFIQSWFMDGFTFLPTILAGVFNGCIYRHGYGAQILFSKFFTKESIQKTEIWTGTYNEDLMKSQFFCNKKKSQSLIQDSMFNDDKDIYSATHLRYMSDEPDTINQLSKVCSASASIPYIVKKQKICNHHNSDGGIMYASPMVALKNELYNLLIGTTSFNQAKHEQINILPNGDIQQVKSNPDLRRKRRFCHYYIGSYDVESTDYDHDKRENYQQTKLSRILHASLLIDRSSGIDILRSLAGNKINKIKHIHYQQIKFTLLAKVLKWLHYNAEHYSCHLYPYGHPSIKLTDFKEEDINYEIKKSRKRYGINIWYLRKES